MPSAAQPDAVILVLSADTCSVVPIILQTKLQERDNALAQRQSQVLELHTELSQLQRLFKMGPAGALRSSTRLVSAPSSPAAAWGAQDSGGVYSPTRAGGQLGSAGSRSAPEEVLAAATDGELAVKVAAAAGWDTALQLLQTFKSHALVFLIHILSSMLWPACQRYPTA